MGKWKKVLAVLLAGLLLAVSVPLSAFPVAAATVEDSKSIVLGTDAGITRAEWLHDLAVVFDMSVESGTEPDNYFQDLPDTHTYYHDVILNVEFGVLDIEAGGEVFPDAPVTRDFAASTLNYCLGYQAEESDVYSFTDHADCTAPTAALVAVERGWLQLVDGKFLPDTPVTKAEVTTMLNDALAVLDTAAIDSTYDSTYTFDEDVVVIPEGTAVSEQADGTIRVAAASVSLAAGQRFAVYRNGIPAVYTAKSVETVDGMLVIVPAGEADATAFTQVDAQGQISSDAMEFTAAEGVEMEVEETAVPTPARARGVRRVAGSVPVKKNLTLTKKFFDGMGKVSVTLNNLAVDYQVNNGYTYVALVGDVTINYSANISASSAFGLQPLTLLTCSIGGIGSFDVTAQVDLSGSLSGTVSGYLVAGIECQKGERIRSVRSFQQTQYYCNAEVAASAGLRVSLGVTKLPVVKAYVYAEAGARMGLKATSYGDGQAPKRCVHFAAYLYAKYGAEASVSFAGWSVSANFSADIYKESNSPLRIVHHYEDGMEVPACTRGQVYTSNFFTRGNSRYGGSGWIGANGEYGLTADGKPFKLYEYSLDNDGNATITKYNGNSYSVYIPVQLDGHPVTAIGNKAFQNKGLSYVVIPNDVITIGNSAFSGCKSLREVTIPDSVTSIGESAFSSCSALESVRLSQGLKNLGGDAFAYTALRSIEIPKSLEWADYAGLSRSSGPFYKCNLLKTVTFGQGTTAIVQYLFAGCTGLETITIPDTVTEIKQYAFYGCTALKNVTISDSVTSIGESAFSSCSALESVRLSQGLKNLGGDAFAYTALRSIEIPKSLEWADYAGLSRSSGPFYKCNLLKTVTFGQGTTAIVQYLFAGCTGLETITIPDTVTEIKQYAFCECTALKSVTIPNSVTGIRESAFSGCTALQNMTIPDSVTSIVDCVFSGCTALQNITIPDSVTSVGEQAFYGCSALQNITIPDSVTSIGGSVFYGCSALESVRLSEKMTRIPSYAFQNCAALKTVQLPAGITAVGAYAFRNCVALEKIALPQSVKTLGGNAFQGCEALAELTLADYGLTAIEGYTFKDCPSLKAVTLPKGLKTVGKEAFMNDTALTQVTVPDSVTAIDSTAFSYPAKTTIYGSKGTYAETFANEGGFTFRDTHVACEGLALADGAEYIVLDVGESYRAVFECYPENTTDVITLTASNSNVSVSGLDLYARYAGDTTVTATTGSGMTYAFTVHVRAPRRIEITQAPAKTQYVLGESFDTAGMVVTVVYGDGSTKEAAAYAISGFDSSVEGESTVTVTWTAANGSIYKTTLTVTVVDPRPKLTGITIKTLPDKTVYLKREKLDLTGLVVEGLYTDGSARPITDYTVSGYNALKTGTQTITVTSGGFTATFTVTVRVGADECAHTRTTVYEAVASTCQTAGHGAYTQCDDCGKILSGSDARLPLAAHTGGEATCVSQAVCTVCGAAYGEKNADNHKHTEVRNAKEATCREKGYTGDTYCTDCGKMLTAGKDLPLTKHLYTGKTVVERAATCETEGILRTYCSGEGCTEYITTPIPKKNHTWDAGVISRAATCIAPGERLYTCTVCSATKTEEVSVGDHTYGPWKITELPSNEKPGVRVRECAVCGKTQTEAVAAGTVISAVELTSVSGRAGQEVRVEVRLRNNPGIISIRLGVSYDTSRLTLKNVAVKDLADVSFGPLNNQPFTLSWLDAIHGDMTQDSVLAVLTFVVAEDAPEGSIPITISYDPEDLYNSQWENVDFAVVDGAVRVVNSTPGDMDGNGKINMKDFGLLQQYLNGWDVDIDLAAADVTGDGKINMKDLSLLQQYLNGWDVKLG